MKLLRAGTASNHRCPVCRLGIGVVVADTLSTQQIVGLRCARRQCEAFFTVGGAPPEKKLPLILA
jgi:hypothetical protein